MPYYYTDASRENDPHALPDVEVFFGWNCECVNGCAGYWISVGGDQNGCPECGGDHIDNPESGYFFAFGSPGCLWDGEPSGPYTTEAEALAAAREQSGRCRHGIDEMQPCARCDVGTLDAMAATRLCAELALRVGNDGTGTLGVIVREALDSDPKVTIDELVEIVREAREEAGDPTGHGLWNVPCPECESTGPRHYDDCPSR